MITHINNKFNTVNYYIISSSERYDCSYFGMLSYDISEAKTPEELKQQVETYLAIIRGEDIALDQNMGHEGFKRFFDNPEEFKRLQHLGTDVVTF